MKAVVVETKKEYAIALSERGTFIRVNNDGIMQVGHEVDVPGRICNKMARIISIAAMLVLVIGLGCGAYLYNIPYSYVDIDINPSMELTVNIFDRIIGAEGFNVEGSEIVSSLQLVNRSLEDGVGMVVSEARVREYIRENYSDVVLFTVVSRNEQKAEILSSRLLESAAPEIADDETSSLMVQKVEMEKYEKSKDNNISPGKKMIIEKVIENNPEVEPEALENAPIGEIIRNYGRSIDITENKDRARTDKGGKDNNSNTVLVSGHGKEKPGEEKDKEDNEDKGNNENKKKNASKEDKNNGKEDKNNDKANKNNGKANGNNGKESKNGSKENGDNGKEKWNNGKESNNNSKENGDNGKEKWNNGKESKNNSKENRGDNRDNGDNKNNGNTENNKKSAGKENRNNSKENRKKDRGNRSNSEEDGNSNGKNKGDKSNSEGIGNKSNFINKENSGMNSKIEGTGMIFNGSYATTYLTRTTIIKQGMINNRDTERENNSNKEVGSYKTGNNKNSKNGDNIIDKNGNGNSNNKKGSGSIGNSNNKKDSGRIGNSNNKKDSGRNGNSNNKKGSGRNGNSNNKKDSGSNGNSNNKKDSGSNGNKIKSLKRQ